MASYKIPTGANIWERDNTTGIISIAPFKRIVDSRGKVTYDIFPDPMKAYCFAATKKKAIKNFQNNNNLLPNIKTEPDNEQQESNGTTDSGSNDHSTEEVKAEVQENN